MAVVTAVFMIEGGKKLFVKSCVFYIIGSGFINFGARGEIRPERGLVFFTLVCDEVEAGFNPKNLHDGPFSFDT